MILGDRLTSMSKVFAIVIEILIAAILLASCGQSTHLAPIGEFQQPPSKLLQHHIVAHGETLYSIAWRYNLDYRALAKINNIGVNFTIFPGQRLLLKGVPSKKEWSKRKVESTNTAKRRPASSPKTPVVTPAGEVQKTNNRSIKGTKEASKAVSKTTTFDSKTWVWPVKGKVNVRFKSNGGLNKGIDIQTKLGEPVFAAAAGEIVYSGSGLRGYGKLLIIKHDAKFLSAYAHNRKLLVKEGEQVKAGQKIAEAGSTGTDTVKLHFEIRHDGKPVDPLRYLPK